MHTNTHACVHMHTEKKKLKGNVPNCQTDWVGIQGLLAFSGLFPSLGKGPFQN